MSCCMCDITIISKKANNEIKITKTRIYDMCLFLCEVAKMKEFAKAFYWGKRWKTCKKSYIEKRILIDGGLCEECKKNLGYIVHHKIHLNEYNINDRKYLLIIVS